jgi:hypothetical protein
VCGPRSDGRVEVVGGQIPRAIVLAPGDQMFQRGLAWRLVAPPQGDVDHRACLFGVQVGSGVHRARDDDGGVPER